jgi:rare lipoprotein A
MNYQTLTGLTALVATLALSTPASATPSVNSSQSNISSNQLIAQSVGIASFYSGGPSEGGSITANGERFNPNSSTAAHRTLPFGTRVRVTSVRTGKSVVVRINNRGPFIGGRIIDLSVGAARAIGLTDTGIGKVRMDILSGGERSGGRRHGRRNR